MLKNSGYPIKKKWYTCLKLPWTILWTQSNKFKQSYQIQWDRFTETQWNALHLILIGIPLIKIAYFKQINDKSKEKYKPVNNKELIEILGFSVFDFSFLLIGIE